jgi:hypothetical protein
MDSGVREAIRRTTGARIPSRALTRDLDLLFALPPELRVEKFYSPLRADGPGAYQSFMDTAEAHLGSPFGTFIDDPVGFTEWILGESVWSIQKDILRAVPTTKRVMVPAGFGLGKTHVAAYAAVWYSAVHPVGTAITVTTATRFRQVQRQLWPHIRRVHAKANLPGECDIAQWKMPDLNGVDTVVAYGFTAPEHDEAAMQGIHAPKVLLIVDEAGGIGRAVGGSTRNLLTGDAHMLAIGNPPTDDESSWFEVACEDGKDPNRRETVTIQIPARTSPAITGEECWCKSCPPLAGRHSVGIHLVDQDWVDDAIREHGDDAPYVIAKVNAEFPKGGASRAIPSAYVDAALEAAYVEDWWAAEDMPETPVSVDRNGKPYPVQPYLYADIKLGVDVAADGGDEFVIARLEGDIARIRLVQSGAANESSHDVAGKILEEIHLAEQLAAALGSDTPVTVKVDAIGIGWGVCGTLEAWGAEGIHNSDIVRVVVSESPDKPADKKALWRPANKRAEMWLNGRNQLQPDDAGRPRMRLDVDGRTAAQLRAPMYGTNTAGNQVIEQKKHMKERGVSSPDRAEAVLLAAYEIKRRRKRGLIG